LKREAQETGWEGAHLDRFEGERHFVTGGALCGPAPIYVAHAWDASFSDLAACLLRDAAGELDARYSIDLFSTDLISPPDDPVVVAQAAIAGAREVLLVLDAEGIALKRLWVLFESMVALEKGKLRVRCSAPGGFGDTEAALREWTGRIDALDWVLSEATRKSDEKRLRWFAERTWEMHGKGIERVLAQFRKFLRKEVYGQILVGAVCRGDRHTCETLLDEGASIEQLDGHGNTLEEIASSEGFGELEEMLFERRMAGKPHCPLSTYFEVGELMASTEEVPDEVLAPFFTELGADVGACLAEPMADEEYDEDDVVVSLGDQATLPDLGPFSHRSGSSTRTPGSTPSARRRSSHSKA